MKKHALLAVLLWCGSLSAYSQEISFSKESEPEMGTDAAQYMREVLKDAKNAKSIKKIVINDQSRESDHTPCSAFKYAITNNKGAVTITAGGCWALRKATLTMAQQLSKGTLKNGWKTEGSVEGERLFPKDKAITLRILDDNIWNNGDEKFIKAWKDINVDCRNSARCPEYVALVKAYDPDIITLQEYDCYMGKMFEEKMDKEGFCKVTATAQEWHFTPIFYKKDVLKLIESDNVQYMPKEWASWHKDTNSGSKSFTWAVFEYKATGKVFAVLNTHLWYANDKIIPGSAMARAAQTRLMMAQADVLKAKYKNCPIFVTGDMNDIESSPALQQFITAGYVPCYKAATGLTNHDNGHHVCAPQVTYSRHSNRVSPLRELGAIDHCLINAPMNDVEIRNFDCIQAYFTIKLTDHYPNLVDAIFK